MLKYINKIITFAIVFALASVNIGVVVSAQDTDDSYSIASDASATYLNTVDNTKRRVLFSENWKFHYGEQSNAELTNFDDSKWRSLNLPHDYSLELPYTNQGEAESGFKLGGTGWYRKSFTIDESAKDKRVVIDFGGVYMRSTVYVNGTEVGFHPNGYTPFAYDITDYLNVDEENTIAVKVDHKFPSSRWYSGSGIYRDVYLNIIDDVAVAQYGVQITDDLNDATQDKKVVNVTSTINNENDAPVKATIKQTIREKKSQNFVASNEEAITIDKNSSKVSNVKLDVNNPTLWDIENPFLYEVVTEVTVDDKVVDTYVSDYGIRTFEFNADTGFYLNGKAVKLQGVSMHSDQGSLGSAAHIRAMERQVEILLDMGVNAIRVTHNPAANELMEIANRKGMLIIDESFDTWVGYKNGNIYDYAEWFNKKIGESNLIDSKADMTWAEYDIKKMVKRGINDPSIISWSIGNEVMEGNSGPYTDYPNIAKKLAKWVAEVDTTRPATIGENKLKANWNESKEIGKELTKLGGTVGFNYASGADFDKYHKDFPEWKMYGAETSSSTNSRGVYKPSNYTNHLTAYDESAVGWGALSADSWHRIIKRDFMAGEFVWTGFDYLGEPTPWNGTGSGSGTWPAPKSSYFGIVDTAGLPKDRFYFYQSQWNKKVDTLHLLPAWEESMVQISNGNVRVDVYSNAKKVELFFKGEDGIEKSLGTKEFTKHTTPAGHTYQLYEGEGIKGEEFRNMYLTWNVPYVDGEVYAVAYDENNNVISETEGRNSVKTFSEATSLKAVADRSTIDADNRDLSYITIDVTDKDGLTVDNALNMINVSVEGNGVLMALDNGDQMDHEPYDSGKRKAFNGKLVAIVKSTDKDGEIKVNIESAGLEKTSVTIQTEKVEEEVEEGVIKAYIMPKNYIVKTGHEVKLQDTATIEFTDGKTEKVTVNWDTKNKSNSDEGYEVIRGVIENYDLKVSANVSYVDEVGALLDYSTAVLVGTEEVLLPTSRPLVLATGEISDINFPVVWEAQDAANYTKEGLVEIKASARIFGEDHEVTATVRVAKAEVKVGANVAPNYLTLTQSIPEDQQSDFLKAIVDGSKDPKSVGEDEPNPSVWTNYKYAQTGKNEAEIVFTYATAQLLAEANLSWYQDGWSARLPQSVKFFWSRLDASANEWTEIDYTSDRLVDQGTVPNSYTDGKYKFDPVPAVSFKIVIESKTAFDNEPGKEHKPAVGLTEVELNVATTSLELGRTAALESLTINGKEISDAVLQTKVVNTEYQIAEIEAVGKDNASVTILDANDNVIRILVESEDQKERSVYVINLDARKDSLEADNATQDYPYTKLKGKDGGHQTGHATEGSIDYALDNNLGTIFHSPWTPIDKENFWFTLELEEVSKLDGLRYLSRSGEPNGIAKEYEIFTSVDGETWTGPISKGEFTSQSDKWSYAQFDEVIETKYVKFQALSTYGAGNQANKFFSAKEVRLRLASSEGIDISDAEVTLDKTEYAYDGKAKTPTPTVTLDGETLVKGVHYKVSYVDNVEAGEATVVIKGIEDYTGETFAKFTIVKSAVELDKDALQTIINEAKAYNKDEYTRVSYANLVTATEEAETVLETAETQTEINAAVATVRKAIDDLVKVEDLDTSEIDAIIAEYDEAYLAQFTEESVTNYLAEVDAIKEALKTAELQTEVDDLHSRLIEAVENLELKKEVVDTEALEAILVEYENVGPEYYSKESYANFTKAYNDAKSLIDKVSEDTTQEAVDAAHDNLVEAYEALEIDPTTLVGLIKEAKKYDGTQYTEASFDKLLVAIDNAEKAVKEPTSTDSLKAAEKALNEAIQGLKEAETKLNTSKLEAKILEAKNLDKELYTEESVEALTQAIKDAEKALNEAKTDADVEKAITALQVAIDALEKVDNNLPQEPSKPGDGNTNKPGDGNTNKPGDGNTNKPDAGNTNKPGAGNTDTPDKGDKLPTTGSPSAFMRLSIASVSVLAGLYFYIKNRKNKTTN